MSASDDAAFGHALKTGHATMRVIGALQRGDAWATLRATETLLRVSGREQTDARDLRAAFMHYTASTLPPSLAQEARELAGRTVRATLTASGPAKEASQ